MKVDRRKVASLLMAGCMTTSMVAPAFAGNQISSEPSLMAEAEHAHSKRVAVPSLSDFQDVINEVIPDSEQNPNDFMVVEGFEPSWEADGTCMISIGYDKNRGIPNEGKFKISSDEDTLVEIPGLVLEKLDLNSFAVDVNDSFILRVSVSPSVDAATVLNNNMFLFYDGKSMNYNIHKKQKKIPEFELVENQVCEIKVPEIDSFRPKFYIHFKFRTSKNDPKDLSCVFTLHKSGSKERYMTSSADHVREDAEFCSNYFSSWYECPTPGVYDLYRQNFKVENGITIYDEEQYVGSIEVKTKVWYRQSDIKITSDPKINVEFPCKVKTGEYKSVPFTLNVPEFPNSEYFNPSMFYCFKKDGSESDCKVTMDRSKSLGENNYAFFLNVPYSEDKVGTEDIILYYRRDHEKVEFPPDESIVERVGEFHLSYSVDEQLFTASDEVVEETCTFTDKQLLKEYVIKKIPLTTLKSLNDGELPDFRDFSFRTKSGVLCFNDPKGLDVLVPVGISFANEERPSNSLVLEYKISKGAAFEASRPIFKNAYLQYRGEEKIRPIKFTYDEKKTPDVEILENQVAVAEIDEFPWAGTWYNFYLDYQSKYQITADTLEKNLKVYKAGTTEEVHPSPYSVLVDGKKKIRFRFQYGEMPSGFYDFYFKDLYAGTMELQFKKVPIKSDFKLVSSAVNFEFPSDVKNGDVARAKIRISNPDDMSFSWRNLKFLDKELNLKNYIYPVGRTRLDNNEIDVNVEMKYDENIPSTEELLLYYFDSDYYKPRIGSIPISVTVQTNNDSENAQKLHDILTQKHGEDLKNNVLPSVTLEYDESYTNDKDKQAAKLQAIMQAEVDNMIRSDPENMDPYKESKISFTYNKETDQFKSVVTLGEATTPAKIWTVTVKAKPVPEIKPSVDINDVKLTTKATKKINVSFGSGTSAANSATVSVRDEQIATVNNKTITGTNLSDGLVITGVKNGKTIVEITFNDKAATKIEIPVQVSPKTYSVMAGSSNEKFGTVKADIANYNGNLEEGQSVTFTFQPKDGYEVKRILVDTTVIENIKDKYTFSNVSDNHRLMVQFGPKKTVVDTLPSVGMSSISMTRGTKKTIPVNFGTGIHMATSATVVSNNSKIASATPNAVTADNLANGIVASGLQNGSTTIRVTFNDKNKTTIDISVQVLEPSGGGSSGGGSHSGGGGGGGSSVVSRKPKLKYDKKLGEVTVKSDNKTVVIKPKEGYRIREVWANDKSVGAVPQYEFKTVSSSNTLRVEFEKLNKISDQPLDSNLHSKFKDVNGHWAEPYIADFENTGWVVGFTPEIFAPDMNMTRGMFVTVLGRMNKVPNKVNDTFSDVSQTAYYAPYVAWAQVNGITDGIGENKFAPDRNISRQEMAVMVARYLKNQGVPLDYKAHKSFTDDADIGEWAKDDIYAMLNLGIVKGIKDGSYLPQNTATRAELVTVLHRVAQLMGKLSA